MNTCYGLVFCASGFMLPQLEDPEVGFGIDKEQGSWFGKCKSYKKNFHNFVLF